MTDQHAQELKVERDLLARLLADALKHTPESYSTSIIQTMDRRKAEAECTMWAKKAECWLRNFAASTPQSEWTRTEAAGVSLLPELVELRKAEAVRDQLREWSRATSRLNLLNLQLRDSKVDMVEGSEWRRLVTAKSDAEEKEYTLRLSLLSAVEKGNTNE